MTLDEMIEHWAAREAYWNQAGRPGMAVRAAAYREALTRLRDLRAKRGTT